MARSANRTNLTDRDRREDRLREQADQQGLKLYSSPHSYLLLDDGGNEFCAETLDEVEQVLEQDEAGWQHFQETGETPGMRRRREAADARPARG